MKLFDLHCDTASACLEKAESLYDNSLQLSLKQGESFETWVQTFAFWIDDRYRGEAAWEQFEKQYRYFMRQRELWPEKIALMDGIPVNGRCNALLSVEGGAVLGGKLERVETLREMGIRFLTLTWNGANELGSGVAAEGGLTPFGRQVLSELERLEILADVSHLNEEGFWEAAELAEKPFIATHSNAKKICSHPRNLTDEQISLIFQRGGLIGINFYPLFVTGEEDCSLDDICRHIEHMLSLGGERQIALGSDFDGALMPKEISQIKRLDKLYSNMIKYFSEDIAKHIFYENAMGFVSRHCHFDMK